VQFRDIRLGAVLVPIGVAIVLISALTWYGFVRVPAREAYLNERNLRLLSTVSGAIKAKIESFDGALDHAVNSFKPTRNKDAVETFRQAVRLFAPDLEIVALDPPRVAHGSDDPNAPEARLLKAAADPPRVLVERDEGRYYLYLGARLQGDGDSVVTIFARSDLEAVLAPLLDGKSEFTAVMVTTASGEVIAQNSSVGPTLSRLDGVISPRPNAAAAKDAAAQPAPFPTLSSFSNMVPVNIGEVGYKLYMQPISFSLLSMETHDGERQAEQWVLCGLVRADRFRAESSALSYTTLLWLSGILAIFTLSLSFVKLRAIGPRERLRASDARWITATTFIAVGLLTLSALDLWAFGGWFRDAVDRRLQEVATRITRRVDAEVVRLNNQWAAFELGLHDDFAAVANELRRKNQVIPTIDVEPEKGPVSCHPDPACKLNVLEPQSGINVTEYPFFDQVTWSGRNGWQRVRWTPGRRIKPFINILDEKLHYAGRAQAAWNAAGAAPAKGVAVESSPTTGDPLTVFWRTGRPDATQTPAAEPWVQSLAVATLFSLDRPMLPKGVSFAVVDKDGLVLFHSVPNHRLRENFLKECEDNGHLWALLQSGQRDQIQVRYRGHDVDLSVSPLELSALDSKEDPGWRLVIFQDAQIVDTVNLETITIACWLFAVYGCILGIAGTLTVRFGLLPRKWFWPDPGKRAAYWAATLLNAVAVGVFAALFRIGTALNRPDAILIGTIALTIVTSIATCRIVVHARTTAETDTFGWQHPFYLARAAFLIVVGALPAAACFHAAYTFETTLLAKGEFETRSLDTLALNDRILETAAQIGQSRPQAADRVREFLSESTYAPLWDEAYVPAGKAAQIETWNGILQRMHRRYNDIAIGLESSARAIAKELAESKAPDLAMPVPAPPPAPNAFWLLVAIATLFVCCYVVVYWLVRPLFVLAAVMPSPSATTPADLPGRHVLVFGPPGSGKSTALAHRPDMRVFDVATRRWMERRRHAVPVPKERRLALLGAAVGEFRHIWREPYERDSFEQEAPAPPASAAPGGGEWADTFDYATLPGSIAIDHVDYRLEERAFASQTLTFVERVAYRDGGTVQIVSDRDPLACLRESGAPAPEMDRWVRALRSFRTQWVRYRQGRARNV
jgi:hypothetical protein